MGRLIGEHGAIVRRELREESGAATTARCPVDRGPAALDQGGATVYGRMLELFDGHAPTPTAA